MTLRFDVNLSILFTELPLLDRPAAARAAGFTAAEFWWPFGTEAVPSDQDADAFGARGLVSVPEHAKRFGDNIDVAVGIAERTGCRNLNALYGNRIKGLAADGLSALLGGSMNSFPGTLFAENVGLVQMTGVGSRLSLLPAYASDRFGNSIFFEKFPDWAQIVFGSPITIAVVVAFTLNVVFNHRGGVAGRAPALTARPPATAGPAAGSDAAPALVLQRSPATSPLP